MPVCRALPSSPLPSSSPIWLIQKSRAPMMTYTDHGEDRDEHETAAAEPPHHGQQRELADDRERGELVLRGERDQAQGRAEVDEQQLPRRQRRPVRRGHRRDRPAAQQPQPGRPRVRRRPARHPRGVRAPGRQRAQREGQHRQQQDDADRLRREVVLLDPVEPDEQPGRGPGRAGAAEHRPGQRVHADRPDEHHHGREPAQHDVQVGRARRRRGTTPTGRRTRARRSGRRCPAGARRRRRSHRRSRR